MCGECAYDADMANRRIHIHLTPKTSLMLDKLETQLNKERGPRQNRSALFEEMLMVYKDVREDRRLARKASAQ